MVDARVILIDPDFTGGPLEIFQNGSKWYRCVPSAPERPCVQYT